MKDYKIVINVSDVGGVYSANDDETANELARLECEDIYNRLNGRCTVEVISVEEITEKE